VRDVCLSAVCLAVSLSSLSLPLSLSPSLPLSLSLLFVFEMCLCLILVQGLYEYVTKVLQILGGLPPTFDLVFLVPPSSFLLPPVYSSFVFVVVA
jgi:hypothetical protein